MFYCSQDLSQLGVYSYIELSQALFYFKMEEREKTLLKCSYTALRMFELKEAEFCFQE